MYTQCFPVACSWYISIVIISVCTSQTIETAVESIEIRMEQRQRHHQYCDLYLPKYIPCTKHVADAECARCSCLHEQGKTWNAFIFDEMWHFSQQNRQCAAAAAAPNEIRTRCRSTTAWIYDCVRMSEFHNDITSWVASASSTTERADKQIRNSSEYSWYGKATELPGPWHCSQ